MLALAALLLIVGVDASQSDSAQPTLVSDSDPIALFNKVCLADGVALSPKAFASARYAELPSGARDALQFAFPPTSEPQLQPRSATDREMPNRFLASLPDRHAYLMLAAPAGSAGVAASACAIIWRGNHYPEALAAVRALANIPKEAPVGGTGNPGLNYMAIQTNGMLAGAASFGGWTVLRIAPDKEGS